MKTALYLPFNGANNSTDFIDGSLSAKTITAHGSAKITTANAVFGGSSGLFEKSTNCYVSFAEDDDFDFVIPGTIPKPRDMTFKFWLRLTAYNASYSAVFFIANGIGILINSTGTLYVQLSYSASTYDINTENVVPCPIYLNTDTAISVEVYKGTLYLYKDNGAGKYIRLNAGIDLTSPIYHQNGRLAQVGGVAGTDISVIGNVDDMIVKNGVADGKGATSYPVETTAYAVKSITASLAETIAANDFTLRVNKISDGEMVANRTISAGSTTVETMTDEPVSMTFMPIQGTVWKASHAYAVNDLVFPTDPITTPFYYKRLNASSSGTTEPTWSVAGDDNDSSSQVYTIPDGAGTATRSAKLHTNDGSTNDWLRIDRLAQPVTIGPVIPE